MNENIMAVVSGIIVGVIFGFIKLPLPAPPTLAGVLGIVGLFIGYQLFNFFHP